MSAEMSTAQRGSPWAHGLIVFAGAIGHPGGDQALEVPVRGPQSRGIGR
jgi:hypothetical protein